MKKGIEYNARALYRERVMKLNKLRFPSTATLLMGVTAFVAILTYIIPAGMFDRILDENTGRNIVVADSFQYIDQTPISIGELLQAPYWGLSEVVDIIAILFIIGGSMGIVIESGAIHAAIGSLSKKAGDKKNLILLIMMLAFGAGSTSLGMAEEFIVFIPLLVTVSLSLGYDKLTGVAVMLLGTYAAGGFPLIGPFNLMIAQSIAEVPLLSGMGLRAIGCAGTVIIAIHHVLSYGKKVKNDPTKSLLYNKEIGGMVIDSDEIQKNYVNLDDYEFTIQRKIIILVLVAGIGIMAYGVNSYGWWFEQMCAIFLSIGLICGLIAFRGGFDKTINTFMTQASTMAIAVLLVSLSRAIIVVLSKGQIIDTIIYGLSVPLSHLNGVLAAWGIYISQLIINFFVPSSSGQAMVMMPILTPLADIVGISRQVVVNAFTTADYFGNMVIPTHPTTLACLGIAGISYDKWFKFAWPIVVKWSLWTMVILAIGVVTGWAF